MSKQIVVRFESGANAEFVGSENVARYEVAIVERLSAAFGESVEIRNDSPFGTKVEGDFDGPAEEDEAADIVNHTMNQIGNSLSEILN